MGGRHWARWKPALSPHELQLLASLARAMPPVALAIGPGNDAPPRRSAAVATRLLVEGLTDRLVRRSRSGPALVTGRTIHDRWLAALRSDDGALEGSAQEIAALQTAIAGWSRPITAASEFPFRLAFRLEEPADDEDWTIRYLLQGQNDPSLLLSTGLLWKGEKGAPRAEKQVLGSLVGSEPARAKEYLLRSLGQAASLSRSVEASLRSGIPVAATIGTTEAFRFLSEEAAALESAGFGMMLPAWWSRRGTKQRLAMRGTARPAKFKSSSGLSLSALVDVDWRVVVGDLTLTERELAALARVKEPLVRIRGQWVQLSAEEIADALRYWKAKGANGRLSVRELVQLRLAGATGALPIEGIDGTGAVGELLERLDGTRQWQEQAPPEGFMGMLRPYQSRGFSWLDFLKEAGLGACLADDMGLGKTVQTLALLLKDWQAERAPVLLICPTSVTGNWLREAARFAPQLPVMLHHGTDRMRGQDFVKAAQQSALVVSSYALLHREIETLQKVKWKGAVLDEAQNIKNSETKQARAARSLDAAFRIALTGTPVENNVGDLWSIMEFLNPGLLGTHSSFRQRFFIPIQTLRDPEAIERLKRLTNPFILRRLKTDKSVISDLPEKNEMKVYCTLTKEQASLYRAVTGEAELALKSATGMGRKGLVLATLTKLKQICNHPAQFLGDGSEVARRSGKLNRLTEMLGEAVDSADGSLIFTQFTEMGTLLKRHLEENLGREVLFLHGGTPRKQRDAMVDAFQRKDGPLMFILSLKAGGTGLNLTRASHVFHFDRWWNPAVENQATDRAFRIGQTRNVQVHKFLCGGTVEERIDEMIEGKSALASSVVGTGEGWLTELSNADLRKLFALRAEEFD
jgi:SNF2 family DNA or RNA helicase